MIVKKKIKIKKSSRPGMKGMGPGARLQSVVLGFPTYTILALDRSFNRSEVSVIQYVKWE